MDGYVLVAESGEQIELLVCGAELALLVGMPVVVLDLPRLSSRGIFS